MKRNKRSLSFVIVLTLFVSSFADDVTLSVNFKKPVSIADEKFLSLTIDPETLYRTNALSTHFDRSTNMAKALSPAYMRLGGPHSNLYSLPKNSPPQNEDSEFLLSDANWNLLHQWAETTGLDIISSIAPEYIAINRRSSPQEIEAASNIISFTDRMGYNTSWQLGYECQTRCNLSASDLGKRIVRLRETLNNIPRYSSSIIAGPDVVVYKTKHQQEYLHDYLSAAYPALSAITWHPDFAGIILNEEGISIQPDDLADNKNDLYRIIGRFGIKRPLWIAESKPEECKSLFLGALVWTRRLGNAAKLKIDVVMRQPLDLSRPTPDYWVSLLHKMLVGREVFDAKIQTRNESHVYFYSQCTKPSEKYEQGAITVFGVNLTPENVAINLRGIKATTIHEYVLLPGFDAPTRMFAESILLNNEPLSLINNTYVPDIKPLVLNDPKGLDFNLPSGGIGFWVLPDLRIKSCIADYENPREKSPLKRIQKRAIDTEFLTTEDADENEGRSASSRDKRKQKNLLNVHMSRKHQIKRELKKLKKFVKRKLDSYELKKPSVFRVASNRVIYEDNEKDTKTDDAPNTQRDIRLTINEFKEHLLKSENFQETNRTVESERIYNETVPEALRLLNKIENVLQVAHQQTLDRSKKIELYYKAKNNLKSLSTLLRRMNLEEPAETSEPNSDNERKRAKRYSDKMITFPTEINKLSENAMLKTGYRNRIKKNFMGTQVQPSLLHRQRSEEDNTFYGFLRAAPPTNFPQGDVFYQSDRSFENENYETNNLKISPEITWADSGSNYGTSGDEFFENYKVTKFQGSGDAKNAELSEAENHGLNNKQEGGVYRSVPEKYGSQGMNEYYKRSTGSEYSKNDYEDDNYEVLKFEYEEPSVKPLKWRGNRMASMNFRSDRNADHKLKMSNYNRNFNNMDFALGDPEGNFYEKRAKRENLGRVFDREVIMEDERGWRGLRDVKKSRFRRSVEDEKREEAVDDNNGQSEGIGSDSVTQSNDSRLDSGVQETSATPEFESSSTANDGPEMEEGDDVDKQLEETEGKDGNDSLENISFAPESSTSMPMLGDEAKDSLEYSWTRQDEDEFFRDEGAKSDEKEKASEAFEKSPTRTSDDAEGSTRSGKEEGTEKNAEVHSGESETLPKATEKSTESGASSSSKPKEEKQEEYDQSEVADLRGVSSQRVNELSDVETSTKVEDRASLQFVKAKKLISRSTNPLELKVKKLDDLIRHNPRLRARAKAPLLGQSRSNRNHKNDVNGALKSVINDAKQREHQNKRVEQVERFKNALLERYQNQIEDIVKRFKMEGGKDLRRREVWEKLLEHDDFQDSTDVKKLEYILKYNPIDYELVEVKGEDGDKVTSERYVVSDGIVRTWNNRGRIVIPKNHHKLDDSTIIEHTNPRALVEKIHLKDIQKHLVKKVDGRTDSGHSYYVIVDDVEDPRVFQYEEKSQDERKNNIQAQFPQRLRNEYNYDDVEREEETDRYGYLRLLEFNSAEADDSNEDVEFKFGGHKICVIDASSYKGGEPVCVIQEPPRESSRAKVRTNEDDSSRKFWKLLVVDSDKNRDTENSEDVKNNIPLYPPIYNNDGKLYITGKVLPKTDNGKVYVKLITNSMSSDAKGENVILNNGERNLLDYISKHVKKPHGNIIENVDNIEITKRISNRGKILEKREPSNPPVAQGLKEQPENDEKNSMEEVNSEVQIAEENDTKNPAPKANDQEKENTRSQRDTDNLKQLSNFFRFARSSEEERSNSDESLPFAFHSFNPRNRGFFSKEDSSRDSSKSSDAEGSQEQVKNSKNFSFDFGKKLKNEKDTRRDDGSRSFEEHDCENKRSGSKDSGEDEESRDVSSELRYRDGSNSREDYKKDVYTKARHSRYSDEDGSEDSRESNDHNPLKAVLILHESDELKIVPLDRKRERHRREIDQGNVEEYEGIEKMQSLNLEELKAEDSSTTASPVSNEIDDVERRMIKKQLMKKYSEKQNSVKGYNKYKNVENRSEQNREFIAEVVPKMENITVDDIKETENITKMFGGKYNDSLANNETNSIKRQWSDPAQNILHVAITNIKRLFTMLGGITQIFHG